MKKTGNARYVAMLVLSSTVALSAATTFQADEALAKGHFDKATAEPAEENLKQGLILMRAGNYEAAIDSFQQAVYFSRNHYNPQAYKYLGLSYKATRNYPQAVEALKNQLNQTTEKEPDVHIDLAECYLNLNEIDKARHEIDLGFVDQGGMGTYRQRYAQGELHEKLKDYGQALGFYENALEEKPHYTEAAMGAGRMNLQLKRYNEALRTYRMILDKGPLFRNVDLYELYCNMGNCFIARGDHQGALDHWRMALEQNPEGYDAHLSLARMFDDEKHYSSSIKEYEAALRCAPESASNTKTVIQRRLAYIESLLAPKEAAPIIKPSPQMRQEYEDAIKQRDPTSNNGLPAGKDSGF